MRAGVIDIALYDCLLEWITPELLTTINTGRIPVRSGDRHLSIVPYGSFPVRGGELVNVAVQNEGQWHRFCVRVLLRPELELDPRYSSNEARLQNPRRARARDRGGLGPRREKRS